MIDRRPNRCAIARLARWALWLVLAGVGVWGGLLARDATFEATAPIRFQADVNNAVRIGRRVVMTSVRQMATTTRPTKIEKPTWPQFFAGYLDVYDNELARASARGNADDNDFRLDYPPGRLLVVSSWVKNVADERGLMVRYDDDMVAPMLWFNTAHELLAAAGIFALVRRAYRNAGRSPLASEAFALLAAALLWFNPALLLSAHGWPQWDAWVLPYTIWAAYFALIDRWLMTGALLAAGAMFKGQVLLVAPLFIFWPLAGLRFDALLRLVAGFVAMAAVAASPWLVWKAGTPGIVWAAGAIVLGAAQLAMPWRWRGNKLWWAVGASLIGWILFATFHAGAAALPGAIALAAAITLLPSEWRGRRLAASCAYAAAVAFLTAYWFGGSFAWLKVGFQTDRFPVLAVGKVVNVPAILGELHGLDAATVAATIPGLGWPGELRSLLRGLAIAGVGIAAYAVARAERRRDVNVLVGFVGAWTIVYALMPQMHERYLVWAAATSAMLVTRGVGGLLVYLAFMALQCVTLLAAMIETSGKTREPTLRAWYAAFDGMIPSAGYAVFTLAAVLLVWSFRSSGPSPRLTDREGTPPAAA